MSRKIFVNLPVKDLKKSMEFFGGLGFTFNPQFTDDNAACMVITEEIHSMLLTHPHFEGFSPHPICDAKQMTEVLIAVEFDSREEVDRVVEKAVSSGGREFNDPQEYPFMYSRAFQDLDGHVWEILWLDPTALPAS
jgi:predicted lactoylglutathione lyase